VARKSKGAKKEKKASGKGGGRKGAAPSVMGFLRRVGGMPQVGDTPAKGLLGDISEEDLREAGRLSSDVDATSEAAPSIVTIEAQLGEPPGRYDHLADMADEGEEAAARLNRARSVGVVAERASAETGRRYDRHPVELRVEYRNAGRVDVEITADISARGAFVATPTPLDVGDPLMLTFELPGERFPVQLAARVKWVTPFGTLEHARAGMGVEFVALDDRKRQALLRLVEAKQQGPGS